MEEKLDLQGVNKGIKIILIIAAVIYGISFTPAGEGFENAKTNLRSMNGPQSMQLDSGTEFFNALSNSFTEIQAGYGSFFKLFNQENGQRMIVNAAIESYKEPLNSTSSWDLGKTVGMLIRISMLIGIIYWIKKLKKKTPSNIKG
jgi:hypothetical protein